MKRIFILIILSVPLYGFGQLYTTTDHYMHNALAINPAYSGSHDALSTAISYRDCWNGFDGSPSTMALSVHTPLNSDRVGVGLFMMNDKYGINNEMRFVGNYAYRINLGYGKLALGLGFGMVFSNAEWSSLAAYDEDDELLAEESSTGIIPDFSIGSYYSTRKYFIGFSLPLFLSHEYNSQTDKYIIRNDFKEYNYILNTGYLIDINPAIQFLPSVLIKYNQRNGAQIDITTQLILKERVWIGAAYRSKNILVGMLQCQVSKQLRIAYSYDFLIGNNQMSYFNTHEIMLNYVLVSKVVASNPRNF